MLRYEGAGLTLWKRDQVMCGLPSGFADGGLTMLAKAEPTLTSLRTLYVRWRSMGSPVAYAMDSTCTHSSEAQLEAETRGHTDMSSFWQAAAPQSVTDQKIMSSIAAVSPQQQSQSRRRAGRRWAPPSVPGGCRAPPRGTPCWEAANTAGLRPSHDPDRVPTRSST